MLTDYKKNSDFFTPRKHLKKKNEWTKPFTSQDLLIHYTTCQQLLAVNEPFLFQKRSCLIKNKNYNNNSN